MKKSTRKTLLVLSSLLIIIGISAGITVAYLTDTDEVTNTFTVGKVYIDLDEAKVNEDGVKAVDAPRVKENTYQLIPGKWYSKDPIVHVEAGSEDSYIFVKVENGLKDIEAANGEVVYADNGSSYEYKSVDNQITTLYGWTQLDENDGIYYRTHEENVDNKDYQVFNEFAINGLKVINAPEDTGTPAPDGKVYISDYDGANINVTAYAIQQLGFANADDAWAAVSAEHP